MESKRKVLVVDDEQDIRAYLSALFEDQGYETEAAGDGEEARRKMEAGAPDLITLDISMPEKSGVRFYREIKADERWRKIPVIIVTGVSEDFRKFISSRHQIPPPEGYLSKPVNREEILEMTKNLLCDSKIGT